MSQLHEDVDLGHTVAGWTGWALAVVGTTVAGVGMCVWRPGIWLGLAICALAAVVTLVLHLVGWGKPAGPRPPDQWDWRVRDLTARSGHPECAGCRLAGRKARAGAPATSTAVEGGVEVGVEVESAPPVAAGGPAGIAGL